MIHKKSTESKNSDVVPGSVLLINSLHLTDELGKIFLRPRFIKREEKKKSSERCHCEHSILGI